MRSPLSTYAATLIFALAAALGVSSCIMAPTTGAPSLNSLFLLSDAQSRSISPENLTGGKGMGGRATLEQGSAKAAAAKLGIGWKVNPYIIIAPGQTFTMGEADGPGVISHIWMTLGGAAEYRSAILRLYWDGEATPSVEAPVGDFFASGWGKGKEPVIDSAVVAVNPGSGFNSFWQMPFRKHFRMTMENRSAKSLTIYYQVNYDLAAVPANAAYFHAQFRMANRLKEKEVFTLLDGVKGRGQYVGVTLAHGAFSPGWWGEGEVKFYIDGDTDFPTINGTGEEDYFLGAYSYVKRDAAGAPHETSYSTAYSGFYATEPVDFATQYFKPGFERRIGEYRWHVMDPVRFGQDLKVTIQALGWDGASPQKILGVGTYKPLEDSLASVAFWYQAEPHAPFPALPEDAAMQIAPPQRP
ncbi:MAG TPA: glycoside hydrolase family 172 protein [Hyphomonadaceae bacterium]|nr:glycoside hydrolase family 172 protein [Hyphomonadaceae bacterium]